jgi:Flp pilus assembly protein TadB
MNRLLILFLAAIALASCSSPKYTYNFDYHDYSAGKRKTETPVAIQAPATEPSVAETTPSTDEAVLTASTSDKPVAIEPVTVGKTKAESSSALSYKDMSRAEKKEFREEVKNEFKKYVQAVKRGEKLDAVGQNSGRLDPDVKMAIIFGAVGVVLFILGGVSEVFTILGAIALLVGVYFLIKWLIRQ